MKTKLLSKPIVSWALYDWANSAFATTVMAGFFPLFFKEYWAKDVSVTDSTFYLGLANSCAGLILAFLAPFLGSFADRGGYKKELLFFFTLMGAAGSLALFFVPQGAWQWAALSYSMAAFAFAASMIPYDSLLVDVTGGNRMDQVSGLGYAFGYLGGGLLFLLNVAWALKPEVFGFSDASQAVRTSFLCVAVWWLIFSIPIFKNVKEHRLDEAPITWEFFTHCWKDIFATAREIIGHKTVLLFLCAYFFYIEGVNTTIKMAVDYGLSLGFESSNLITALLIVQFVAFPFAILFGWIGERFGPVKGLYIGISVYALMSLMAYQMTQVYEFYLMAVAIGMVQGGVQSLSRSHFAAQIPAAKSAQFFGFFNMLGKFSAIIGPVLVGLTVKTTGDSRSTGLVLLFLFAAGLVLLRASQIKKSP